MPPVISIGGSLFILALPFLFLKDKMEIVLIIKRLAAGIALAVICGLIISLHDSSSPFLSLLIVALVEESGKLMAALSGNTQEIEPRKWLISGLAAASGFAFWEHILYVITAGSATLFFYRSLSAVLAHILLTLISVILLLITHKKVRRFFYPVLLLPSIFLHILFNSLASNTFLLGQLACPPVLGIIVFLLYRRFRRMQKSSDIPQKKEKPFSERK